MVDRQDVVEDLLRVVVSKVLPLPDLHCSPHALKVGHLQRLITDMLSHPVAAFLREGILLTLTMSTSSSHS